MPGTVWTLALVSAFFVAVALILTQFGLRHLSATTGASVSVPASTVFFWVLAPYFLDAREWQMKGAAIFAAAGLLFPATVTLLIFEANRRMGPNIAGSVGNLTPLFAVLFAIVALGELPRVGQAVGIAVVVIGVMAISMARGSVTASWPLSTLAFPLAAAAIRGGIQPAVKIGMAFWPNPFAAALIGYTVSSVVLIANAAYRTRGRMAGFNRAGVAWFVAVGLCNGSANLLLYAALERGPVILVSPLVASYPLATLLLSFLLPGTVHVSQRQIFGIIATVCGVALLLSA